MQYKHPQAQPQNPLTCYLSQHLNPKKLPSLLVHILTHSHPIDQSSGKKGKTACKLQASGLPGLSLFMANMKMYDERRIVRENFVVEAMRAMDGLFQCKDDPMAEVNKSQQKNYQRTNTQPTQNPKPNHLKLLEYLSLSSSSFSIFEYRLKDLSSFIDLLSLKPGPGPVAGTDAVEELEKIRAFALGELGRIKGRMERFVDWVLGEGGMYGDGGEQGFGDARDLYSLRKQAKQYKEKIKEINIRYTELSRSILRQQAQINKQKTKRQPLKTQQSQNIPESSPNSKMPPSNPLHPPSSFNTVQSSNYNVNGLSHRSILKNKNGPSNKNKRISIEVITAMMESARLRGEGRDGREMDGEVKDSRFKHRAAVNIGTVKNLAMKAAMVKKKKKQVKIDHVQTSKERQELEDQEEERASLECLDGPTRRQRKSKRKTNLQKYEELCEKADKEDQEQMDNNIWSISQRKCRSWHPEIQPSQTQSKCSIVSRSSRRSKPKSKTAFRSHRRGTRKYTYQRPMKAYSSCRQIKRIRSAKSMKKKSQVSQSLKNIFMDALESKRKRNQGRAGREGKIIGGVQGEAVKVDEEEEKGGRVVVGGRRVYPSNNYKGYRNRYKQLLEQSIKQKDSSQYSQLKELTSKTIQIKSSRRVGVALPAKTDPIHELLSQQTLNPSLSQKNKSQTLSLASSKRYHPSNPRIAAHDRSQLEGRRGKGRKTKTEQSEDGNFVAESCRVRYEEKFSFVGNFVKFYPNIECSLYQITKRNQKMQFLAGSSQEAGRQKMLQFAPMANYQVNKHVHQQNLQVEEREKYMKKKMFEFENLKLQLSRKIVVSANELWQKELGSARN